MKTATMIAPSKQILCIEDDAETAALIAEDLQERGYIVNIASGGHEGLNAILKTSPDLVLCDINMPGMGGFEVMEYLTSLAPQQRGGAVHFPHRAQGIAKKRTQRSDDSAPMTTSPNQSILRFLPRSSRRA